MKCLIVSLKYDNKKLNTYLFNMFPDMLSSTFYKALRKKDIKVNDKRVTENIILHTGDKIEVYISDELLFPYNSSLLNVVYEDDNILIINKPENIEVLGKNSLTSLVQKKYNDNLFPYPCHRLDRNTKGLIIYAKNKESLDILFSKFKNKEIEKHYLSKVYGIPSKKQATLTAYLFKDSKKSKVYISDSFKKGYQKIITSYTVLKTDKKNNFSILDVTLHTGKTHQIRAHLSYIGHPIIGDGKYGINEVNKLFNVKTQELYAYKLKFNFKKDNGILDYLNNKEFKINIQF